MPQVELVSAIAPPLVQLGEADILLVQLATLHHARWYLTLAPDTLHLTLCMGPWTDPHLQLEFIYRVSQNKRTNKTSINVQTWQDCQHSKGVRPRGSEMVNLDVFDNLGPFWVHLDTFGPFQTKINLSPHKDKVVFG